MLVQNSPARVRRGLRGLGGQAIPLSLAQAPVGAPNCPWWLWFTGSYLTCTQQPQLIAQQKADIQSVVDAGAYYGYPASAVAAGQAAADVAMAQTPADVAAVTAGIENSQADQSPLTYAGNWLLNPNASNPSGQSVWGLPTWAWIGIAIVGGLAVVKLVK